MRAQVPSGIAMLKSVGTRAFPLAGTFVSVALHKYEYPSTIRFNHMFSFMKQQKIVDYFNLDRSQPAERGEALEGKTAFSESFFTLRSNEGFSEIAASETPFWPNLGIFSKGSLISGGLLLSRSECAIVRAKCKAHGDEMGMVVSAKNWVLECEKYNMGCV